MKKFCKIIDGKVVHKEQSKIIVINDGMATYNPTEEMLLADGWTEYVAPEPTEEEVIQKAKKMLQRDIIHYDASTYVNSFSINGISLWLDKATRVGLKLRFESEKAMQKENTTLWSNNMEFVLPLDLAIQMLYTIENYASACYDNTQKHLANLSNLTTIHEIENYDYKTGYPDSLEFKTI